MKNIFLNSLKVMTLCLFVLLMAFCMLSCGEDEELQIELMGDDSKLSGKERKIRNKIEDRINGYLTDSKEGDLEGMSKALSFDKRVLFEMYDLFYKPVSHIDAMSKVASHLTKETTDLLVFINKSESAVSWEIQSIRLGDNSADATVKIFQSESSFCVMKYEMVSDSGEWYIKNLKNIDSVRIELVGTELSPEAKEVKARIEERVDSFIKAAADGDFDEKLNNYNPNQSIVLFASLKAAGMGINALITTTTGVIIPVGSLAVNEMVDFLNSFSDITEWEIESILLGKNDAEVCVKQCDSNCEEKYVWYGLVYEYDDWFIDAFYVVAKK